MDFSPPTGEGKKRIRYWIFVFSFRFRSDLVFIKNIRFLLFKSMISSQRHNIFRDLVISVCRKQLGFLRFCKNFLTVRSVLRYPSPIGYHRDVKPTSQCPSGWTVQCLIGILSSCCALRRRWRFDSQCGHVSVSEIYTSCWNPKVPGTRLCNSGKSELQSGRLQLWDSTTEEIEWKKSHRCVVLHPR